MRRVLLLAIFFLAACLPVGGNCVQWAKAYVAEHPKARIAIVDAEAKWCGTYTSYEKTHAVVVIEERDYFVRLIDNGFLFPVPTWVSREEFSRWFVRWYRR